MENKSIFLALAKAQANFKKAVKDSKVAYEGKNGAQGANYRYADLSSIWDCIHNALSENNLFIMHQTYKDNGVLMMRTMVFDEHGQSIETVLPVINAETKDPKAFGSGLTYTRRYSICCLLCVITEDDDATEAQNDYNKRKAQHPNNTPQNPQTNLASDKQVDLVKKLVNSIFFTEQQRLKVLKDVSTMTSSEASIMIERLNKAIQERKASIDTLQSVLTPELWTKEEIEQRVNEILKAKNDEERNKVIMDVVDVNSQREDAIQGEHHEKNSQQ